MVSETLKTLNDEALEILYHDKSKYDGVDLPPIIKGFYKAILEKITLSDIEKELLARGYELEMSN